MTNDKQSRSSRVRKSVAGGDAATRQKFELAYAKDNAVYSGTNLCSISSIGRARHCHCRGKGIETPIGRQVNGR